MWGRPAGALATLLCCAAALPAAAVAGPRALETIVQDDALLLHRDAADVHATAQRLRDLGADRLRITASWSSLAPEAGAEQRPAFDARDPAAYDQEAWRRLDTAVRAAAAAGLKVMLDAGFWAPRWAAAAGDGPRPRTDIDPAAFADFAVALARRYDGTFVPPAPPPAAEPAPSRQPGLVDALLGRDPAPRTAPAGETAPQALPRVDVLALWNEPNHTAFLTPTWVREGGGWVAEAPHRYRAMVAAAYPAVKAVRPDLTVLVGNTSSTGSYGGNAPVPPLRFLRELACVDGGLRPLATPRCEGFARVPGDGYAHHPYALTGSPRRTGLPRQPDSVYVGDLPRLRRTLVALARRGRIAPDLQRIWLTEMGYETAHGGSPRGISEQRQAEYLTWSEREAAAVPGVRSFAQFLLRDVPPAATAQSDSAQRAFGQFSSGLEQADGTPKLAATAFRAGVFAQRRGRRGTTLWIRLRLAGDRVPVAVQRRAGRGPWRTVLRLQAPGRGAVTRHARWVPGARWRVVAAGVTSPDVPTVPAPQARST